MRAGSEKNLEFISLQEATKLCSYSQKYLSLRVRQGKLNAIKIGRNWVTKKQWIDEYLRRVESHKNGHVSHSSTERPYQTTGRIAKAFLHSNILRVARAAAPSAVFLFFVFAAVAFGKEKLWKEFDQTISETAKVVETALAYGASGAHNALQRFAQYSEHSLFAIAKDADDVVHYLGDQTSRTPFSADVFAENAELPAFNSFADANNIISSLPDIPAHAIVSTMWNAGYRTESSSREFHHASLNIAREASYAVQSFGNGFTAGSSNLFISAVSSIDIASLELPAQYFSSSLVSLGARANPVRKLHFSNGVNQVYSTIAAFERPAQYFQSSLLASLKPPALHIYTDISLPSLPRVFRSLGSEGENLFSSNLLASAASDLFASYTEWIKGSFLSLDEAIKHGISKDIALVQEQVSSIQYPVLSIRDSSQRKQETVRKFAEQEAPQQSSPRQSSGQAGQAGKAENRELSADTSQPSTDSGKSLDRAQGKPEAGNQKPQQLAPVKEIVREVVKETQTTKTQVVVDADTKDKVSSLEQIISKVLAIQISSNTDLSELKSITQKIQSTPPSQPQIINTPVYIGNTGLQVGGTGSFESLGVSGSL
ncbi:MAG: hypothetical protein HYV78_01125 [Candidatus Wildermuthbacteria bacterium]|nr:hypothetical protein [Candidatus Wildermuthbacteria bacterium]